MNESYLAIHNIQNIIRVHREYLKSNHSVYLSVAVACCAVKMGKFSTLFQIVYLFM